MPYHITAKVLALRALNVVLPPVGSFASTWLAHSQFKMVRNLGHGDGLKPYYTLQRNAALAVWASTTAFAVAMWQFHKLFTLGGYDGLGHIGGADISLRELGNTINPGSNIEHLDGMV